MLKAVAPLFTLLVSWAVSLKNPKMATLGTMVVIALGAYGSTLGEISLVGRGLWLCMLGTAAECGRLLVVGKLLKEPRRDRFPGTGTPFVLDEEGGEEATGAPMGGMGMSPLVTLYYFAPVCMVLSGTLALAFEMRTLKIAELHRVGWTLGLSCILAFMLNVAGVLLVSRKRSPCIKVADLEITDQQNISTCREPSRNLQIARSYPRLTAGLEHAARVYSDLGVWSLPWRHVLLWALVRWDGTASRRVVRTWKPHDD